MASLDDLTTAWQDLFRGSYNLGYHPAILLGDTMNLDGQRSLMETPLDLLSYTAPQSVQNVNLAPNSVSNWNLNNFSFTKGRGGTLVLGGFSNTNGLLQIDDAAGNVIVSGDNLGSHYFDTSGVEHVSITGAQGQLGLFGNTGAVVTMSNVSGGTPFGFMGYYGPGNAIQLAADNGTKLQLFGDKGATLQAINGDIIIGTTVTGNVEFHTSPPGSFFFNGSKVKFSGAVDDFEFGLNAFSQPVLLFGGNLKTAIVQTTKGYRAMYCTESAEVWFMDFCTVKRRPWWKFWEKDIYTVDSLFSETVSPPYLFIPTMNKNICQVWAKRKGFENIRMEEKTKKQFDKNNEFWSTPNSV